ncbi:ligand-gated channel protein [Idiomarina sp.]|uniref:ligand-gated channel protein n=1 Tax=Idiomarina sp. TaxID=1874361 RepID=UPI0025BC7B8D|nr:ligand-gated channel protein [Idiomarina sp.]
MSIARCTQTRIAAAITMATTAATLALPAHAQDKRHHHKQEKVMETMVITASAGEQLLKDAPASISVIDKRQISKRFYRDLTDALKDAPGVIVTGGGDRQDVSIRGMGRDYTLILVDGQRQTSRETRPNNDGPGVEGAWTPPLAAIERIEIIRGPMSSLYGSDAIGGVINIITRKTPDEWRSEVRFDATLQQRDESGNIYQTNLFTSGSLIDDVLGVQLYGQFSKREEDAIYEGFRGREADNITAKLAFTPSKAHEFLLEAVSQNQTLDATLGKTVEPLAAGEECGRRGCPESSTTDYQGQSISLAHNAFWDFGSSRSYLKKDEFDNKSRLISVDNLDFQTLWSLPLNEQHSLSLGGSYYKEELTDLTTNQISDLTFVDGYQWSLFAEDEWRLAPAFAITVGARYDEDKTFGGHWSPRIYGVWTANHRSTLKVGISTGFRAPGLREITPQWGQVSRGGNVYGNPDLQPEESINYELGWYRQWRHGSGNITVFYNEFKDKITRVACPQTICDAGPNQFGSLPTTRVNVDEAVTQGVELSASHKFTRRWKLSGNYTYTDSEQKTGEYAGSPLNQLPKHLIQLSMDYAWNKQTNSWIRVHYRGEESQPVTGPSQDSLIAPSYTLTDLGVNYALTPAVKLSAGLYNVFNEQIMVADYGYVEDGRRLWLSAAVSF